MAKGNKKNKYPNKPREAPTAERPEAAQQPVQTTSNTRPIVPTTQPGQHSHPTMATRPAQQSRPTGYKPGPITPRSVGNLSAISIPKAVEWQPGTLGKPIKVKVNFLALCLQQLPDTAHHYDVEFDPERMPKRFLPVAVKKFQALYFPNRPFAFDGRRNVYTNELLMKKHEDKSGEVKFLCPDTGKEKTITVTIKWAAEVDFRPLKGRFAGTTADDVPQSALQCLNAVLRSAHDREGIVAWKRAFFDPSKPKDQLGNNHELWQGLFQSVVLGWRPYLNVDVANKVFPRPLPLLEWAHGQTDTDRDRRKLDESLNGVRLVYTPPDAPTNQRTYTSQGLARSANDEYLTDENGRRLMTVAQYFAQKNYRLRYPNLPCIKTGRPGSAVLPMEFCIVARDQATNKQAPDDCTQEMIKKTAVSTDQRQKKILELVGDANYAHPVIEQFGLRVDSAFAVTNARILNEPALEYAGSKIVTPKSGVWQLRANEKFNTPVTISKWSVLCLAKVLPSVIGTFSRLLINEGAKRGMAIAEVGDINCELMNSGRRLQIGDVQDIMSRMHRDGVELIVCIIGDDAAYDKVKKASEHNVGILTSCIKSNTINRRDKRTGEMDISFVQNILLKINAKVGGVNQKMQKPIVNLLKGRPFMVIGADVTHPSPDQTRIPSLVGMAASSDRNAFKYNCTWRIQSPTREMIDDFGDMVKVHLLRFKEVNKFFPHIILYYRDGVSDGQFEEVLQIEHQSLMKACAQLQPDYKPDVTVIVVQKRHRIRFFPMTPAEGDGRNVNVKPGTIVDTDIVDLKKKQFYLVAHAAIQGVARPAKYQIIHDDSDFSADLIQEVTHGLCHMFTRCNRTVSYVAPTYYAHLVAARGRSYVRGSDLDMENLAEENANRQINAAFAQRNPMFFV